MGSDLLMDAVQDEPNRTFGGRGALADRMGITITEAGPERVVGSSLHASRVGGGIAVGGRLTCLLRRPSRT
jgi:hypothetical protein